MHCLVLQSMPAYLLTFCVLLLRQIWITVVVAVLSATMSTSAIDSLQVTPHRAFSLLPRRP